MNASPIGILLIGPLSRRGGPIGGAVVSFSHLFDYLSEQPEWKLNVVNTNLELRHPLLRSILVLFHCIRYAWANKILWANLSRPGFIYLSPLLWVLAKLSGKKFVLRKFGGDAIENYNQLPGWWKWLLCKTSLKADLLLLQTKRELAFFAPLSKRTTWFPTTRPKQVPTRKGPFKKRFIFISRVTKTKGLDEIVAVYKTLAADYTIEVYGPMVDAEYADLSFYHGTLSPAEVAQKLAAFDVLLLPTYYPGEGYPGIIIEAFRAGLPVVTTQWQALPEIVQNKRNGIVIPPQDAAALQTAIQSFDATNYPSYSQAAKDGFNDFCLELVNPRILAEVKALLLR